MTNQTICLTLLRMLDSSIRRLLDAYPAIFLACHRRHLRDDASGKAVTEHQASVLDHLHPSRATTISKLAEHMGVGRSTMSITVRRLASRGYIACRRDRSDSRCVCLTLTRAGARIREQNTLLDPELVQKIFRLMSPATLESALAGMESLAKYANALLRQRSRGHER